MENLANFCNKSSSATERNQLMRDIKNIVESINDELLHAIDIGLKKNTRFDDLEETVFFQHYLVHALRNLPQLEKSIKELKQTIDAKIPFLKQREQQKKSASGVLTTFLNDKKTEVLAKLYKGSPTAVTYANRTQAYRKKEELGSGWEVIRRGRPFYVAKWPN